MNTNARLRWQAATLVLLFAGYAGYYFCRVNLSVSTPLIIADLHAHGISISDATVQIGTLASLGTLAYALGKFFLAGSGDFFGGKRNFLLGMLGAIIFTIIFASAGGLPLFTFAWIANRLTQSIGWAGLVKISSKWFPYSSYGSAMAVLSLSFLVGDAVTRGSMGALIAAGFGWRQLFFIAAGALLVILLINAFALKESSVDAGFPPPDVNPLNVFGGSGAEERPTNLRALLVPLFRSPPFWIVCALSFGTTLLRETFSVWTPTYYASGLGFSAAQAAAYSALFPTAGAISVLAAGWLSDRLGPTGRANISLVGYVLAACSLAGLGLLPPGAGAIAVALVFAVGLFNTGPYSYLAGAIALDFGGRKGGAFTSGIIDGVGYLGGALAGVAVARIELAFGWGGAFLSLAALMAVTAACAAGLVHVERRRLAKEAATT